MSKHKHNKIVMCMKWGTLYTSEYVNVLYNAVCEHLQKPFRFVCLTDNAIGLNATIEVYPIPEMNLEASHFKFGGWPKLAIFKKDLYGLKGRCLFIDLDSIIFSDINSMLQNLSGIYLIRDWSGPVRYLFPWIKRGATGILAFTLGTQAQIYTQFMENQQASLAKYRNEQQFVTAYARDLNFWPHPWVISFKLHLLAPPILNRFIKPKIPKRNVKIVAFHGAPRPLELVAHKNQTWGRWYRYGKGAVPFVRYYWLKYGGQDPK